MNVLSLFDGMSCGQIALNRVGIKYENYYASEIDFNAIKVTQTNYPNTIQIGSVENWRDWDIPKPDLIMGGSPCQGFSTAGRQLNFEDPRSKLFFTFVDILNHYKPKFFLLENVKMKKEWEYVITNILCVEPVYIDSSLVSAQSRKRLYWFNWESSPIPQKDITMEDLIEEGFYSTKQKSYCLDANYGKGTNFRRFFFCGSRQLVLEKGYSPELLTKESANLVMHKDGNRWRKLTVIECERLQTVPEGYVDNVNIPIFEKYKVLGNGWTIDVVAHIFSQIMTG